ncbi:MAG: hypothetical protein OZSIB_3525 [Candidatus Ozemobacter sibiricus]|uniref:Uncharacterized protein n=1 Tax=Candidatus Ozemobacter sibiricus TaxID=2268124 RepID=A0A367ZQF4_9BACT|nr:MAG: hypothetical protein OZSIB_3525 [Candidatus Ozemobacter sibiricus]
MISKMKILMVVLVGAVLVAGQPQATMAKAKKPTVADAIAAGDACYNNKDFGGALWHYTGARDLNPADPGAWEKMAWAALCLHKFDDAHNFIEEAKNRGMDATRVARVKAWIFIGKADDARAAGDTTNAKKWYQDAKNHASGGVDPAVGKRAAEALSQLSSSSKTSSSSDSTSSSASSSSSSSSSSTSSSATSESTSESSSSDSDDEKTSAKSTTSDSETSSSSKKSSSGSSSSSSQADDDEATVASASDEEEGDATGVKEGPAPEKEVPGLTREIIEARIKKLAKELGYSTATDARGRLGIKNKKGKFIKLPPSIFRPPLASELASGSADVATDAGDEQMGEGFFPESRVPGLTREIIEARIKKWAAKMGYTTATDPHGRLGVKNKSGKFVRLPRSIFRPPLASELTGSDSAKEEAASGASASADVGDTSATIATDTSETVTDPVSTLEGN